MEYRGHENPSRVNDHADIDARDFKNKVRIQALTLSAQLLAGRLEYYAFLAFASDVEAWLIRD